MSNSLIGYISILAFLFLSCLTPADANCDTNSNILKVTTMARGIENDTINITIPWNAGPLGGCDATQGSVHSNNCANHFQILMTSLAELYLWADLFVSYMFQTPSKLITKHRQCL